MRFLALFLMLAGTLAAEIGFLTGQGARLVIGQSTFTDASPGKLITDADGNFSFETSAKLLGGAGGVAYINDMLLVADSNRVNASPLNHRALIYKNISQKWPAPTDELARTSRCPVCVGEADVVLGQDDFKSSVLQLPGQNTLRLPTAIASDGVRVAVADTDNNRVLIWNTIPTTNGQNADIVLGQDGFDTNTTTAFNPTQTSLRGPQGVWFHTDGSLWVADTGNNRIMKWNSPTQSGQPADLVLGAPDFTTFVQQDLTQQSAKASASTLLSPTSVTTDGQRLVVADLGYNRVLIWSTIPGSNGAPADIVIGQPDMEARFSNSSSLLCDPIPQDPPAEGEEPPAPIFPSRCSGTLAFPRYALSDGQRLFIADGGNDRVLVFDKLPTTNGARADEILGQVNEFVNNTSDSAFPNDIASAGVIRTPASLAWDGLNLYVTDPFNRRILVFTMAERRVANTGVRNAASFEIFATGRVTLSGTTVDNDGNFVEDQTVTVKIEEDDNRSYTYTVQKDDNLGDVSVGLAEAINAGDGDPDVLATANAPFAAVILTAKIAGEVGNNIKYAVSTSTNAQFTASRESPSLKGGEEASKIAPYSIVSIVGDNLSDQEATADLSQETLPTELGGVQVYIDGIRAPLYFVSPTQINAQMPVEVLDTQSTSTYVRTVHDNGDIVASNAIPVPIINFNPGIFAESSIDPRPAVAFHSSSHATGVVSVDGTAKTDDEATVIIDGRRYTHKITAQEENPIECPSDCAAGDDTCTPPDTCREKQEAGRRLVMNALIDLINGDPMVQASPSTQFTRIRLKARAAGPVGEGISLATDVSSGASIILTPTVRALCCANEAGARITPRNPAIAGEIISVWATGLGLVEPEEARDAMVTGTKYRGPAANKPTEFVSSLIGGRSANVLHCGLEPGTVGLYRCDLQINQGVVTNNLAAMTIAQGFQVSNVTTIPVFNPDPRADSPLQ